MRPTTLAILTASALMAPAVVFSADGGLVVSGSAGVGLRAVGDNASDPSKANEYRDLSPGVIGIFDVKGRGDEYYFNAFGENLGRDDQYLDFRGGKYGVFKYQLYDNELRHNFGSGPGALSPYSGIGSSRLTAVFPNLNTSTWNNFDNSIKRQDIGAMFEISANSPWYFRFDGNQVKREGVKVIAGAQGTSPGNGFVDLPSPVDFKTGNFSAEAGYASKRGHLAVAVLHSKFTNSNDVLRWSNGFFANGLDTTVLAPDSDLTKISVNGNLRQLPLNSTVAGRITYGKTTNDVSVLQNILSTGGTNPSTAASGPLFHGENINKTASFSLTSHPATAVDTRLYWNWARKANDSTEITFRPLVAAGLSGGGGTICSSTAPCTNELFNYKKNNAGLETGYRINPANKVTAGLDFAETDRLRVDFTHTLDRKYYGEYKNNSLDNVDTRVRYQYLERRSNFSGESGIPTIDTFVRRFDLANVDQHLAKLVFDVTPVPFLDLGFEAIYKHNNYRDTSLGRTGDNRQEFYASISYGDPKSFRVLLFADLETLYYDSQHRVGSGSPDPSTPPTATTYNWSAENHDKSWQIGIGADWLPRERLKVSSSFIFAQTNGSADFTAQNPNPAGGLLPITAFDNTRRTSLNLKATYTVSRQFDISGGYAFEKYRFSDIGYNNFQYTVLSAVPATAATLLSTSYLTGQSAFQNYTANILYVMATYKF